MTYLQWIRVTGKAELARFEELRDKIARNIESNSTSCPEQVLDTTLFEARKVKGRLDALDALKTRALCSKEHLWNVQYLLKGRKEYLEMTLDELKGNWGPKGKPFHRGTDPLEVYAVRGAIELFSEAEAFLTKEAK